MTSFQSCSVYYVYGIGLHYIFLNICCFIAFPGQADMHMCIYDKYFSLKASLRLEFIWFVCYSIYVIYLLPCTFGSRFPICTCIIMFIYITLFPQIWRVSSKECIHTLSHSCAVLSCDFSPNQERLVTGNTDGVISVSSLN